MKIFLSLILTLLIIKCNTDVVLVDEGGFEINGFVLDSSLQLPIQDVIVGFSRYPDSILITDDSMYVLYPYMLTQTDDLGKFRISEIGAINFKTFEDMFAWKKEYSLWCFVLAPVTINEIKKHSYEMNICLSKK